MKLKVRPITRILLFYIILSALWIYGTDWFVHTYGSLYRLPVFIDTLKGWVFILFSAGVIYMLLSAEIRRREADFKGHLSEKEHLYERLRLKNQELLEAYDRTIFGWSRVLELRSREVKDHSRRVTDLAVRLAQHMGLIEPELSHIRRGAMLHDIGKMAIPDRVMQKDGFEDEEWVLMRRHPIFGFEMLSEIEYLRPAIDIVLCHHEKWNGEGYPFGLSGEQIPLYARIFAVADVWDAMLSKRVYHDPHSIDAAIEYLKAEAGGHFDPLVVESFLELIEEEGIIQEVMREMEPALAD